MSKQRVTVDVAVPTWKYCDLQSSRDHKQKTGEHCRFCKEVKKRGELSRYFCLLFNVELTTNRGAVEKTCLCYSSWGKNQIIDLTQSPMEAEDLSIKPKDLKKYITKAIKKVVKTTDQIQKQGLPYDKALDVASKIVIDEW